MIARSLRDLGRSEFKYQPLDPSIDSIRLLVILPRQRREDMKIIRCRLVHVKFLDNPSYEALSYTWVINNNDHGQDVMDYVYVDGAKVKILPNLYLALRSLREDPYWKLPERTVWADAICIDQENLEERLSQVRLMDFIYSRAIGVVVWLGFPSRPDVCITTEEEFILQNRYWTRLWIIQEIALATQIRVYIGDKSYPNSKSWSWDSFLTTLGPMTPPIIRKLDEKRRDRHGPANQLERLLEDFQAAKCKEPRDKIFGFLGLAHDCQDGSIEPDYTRPLLDLYTDMIKFYCRQRSLSSESWNTIERSMRTVRFSHFLQWLLGGGVWLGDQSLPTGAEPTGIVRVMGAITGTIKHIGPAFNEIIGSSSANKRWKLSFQSYNYLSQDIRRLREMNEAYIELLRTRPLLTNDIRWINPRKLWSRGSKMKRRWDSNEESWKIPSPELDAVANELISPDDKFSSVAPLGDQQPRMFLGENFLIGMAPYNAKRGDIIVQFWKTDVVALLRKDFEKEVYRVIGKLHLSTGYLENLKPVYKEWNDPVEGAEMMVIDMEIETLCVLTC
jgi:hypothetical protein